MDRMNYCALHAALRLPALRDRKDRDSHTQRLLGGAVTADVNNLIRPSLGARMAPHSVPVRTATNTSMLRAGALGCVLLSTHNGPTLQEVNSYRGQT